MSLQNKPRPWRVRFTLRLLLASTTVLCIWLAIHTHRARVQREVVKGIHGAWGAVTYDSQNAPTPVGQSRQSPIPKWLLDCLGMDFFHTVVGAHVRGELAEVSRLQSLHSLTIWNEDLSDEDMQHIARMLNLRNLTIHSDKHQTLPGDYPDTTRIGDRSLELIAGLPNLESAYVYGYHFTGQGLAALAKSPSLRDISIHCCDSSVTAADVEPLRSTGRLRSLHVERWSEGVGREVVAKW